MGLYFKVQLQVGCEKEVLVSKFCLISLINKLNKMATNGILGELMRGCNDQSYQVRSNQNVFQAFKLNITDFSWVYTTTKKRICLY